MTADSSLYALGQKVTAGPSSTYNVIRLGLVKETTGPSLRHITIALGQKVIAGPLSTCNVLSHGWAEVTADLTPKHITISPGGQNVTTHHTPWLQKGTADPSPEYRVIYSGWAKQTMGP